jgi:hypothetical protein
LNIKSETEESLGNSQGVLIIRFRNVAELPCSAKAATGILHQRAIKIMRGRTLMVRALPHKLSSN